jgi:uncharacterized protein with PhoU and TrkA domain
MSSDLVKRLRDWHWREGGTRVIVNPDGPEAADRIEALEGEVERLRAALQAIAEKAGKFEGYGSYIAYVELAGEIEKMADAARNGEEP